MPRKNHTPRSTGSRSVGQYKTKAKRHGEPKPPPRWGLKQYEPLPRPEDYDKLPWDWIFALGVK